MAPSTRYAPSGEASIAYQVTGEGALDLLFLPGWISQVEHLWEAPAMRRFLERLAVFNRLILFDRRGTGLSDRTHEEQTLEQDVQDALAVLDAAGSERAALFTYALGGPVGALLAAEHPERVGALIMYASVPRTSWAPDYDWALTREERSEVVRGNFDTWGKPDSPLLETLAPSAADDPALADWLARMQRLTPSLLLRALAHGHMTFFEWAVAELAGVPHHRTWLMIHDAGELGLKAIYERAGLPTRLLPAFRAGVDPYHGVEAEGRDYDRATFQRRMLERFLTQPHPTSRDDLDYLLEKMDRLSETDEARAPEPMRALAAE